MSHDQIRPIIDLQAFNLRGGLTSNNYTPKINMEPKNAGLEDDSPFQFGDF